MHTNNQNQKPGYISYPSRVKINQIDPRLDIFWREDLARVFAALSAEERDSIAQQLLPAKHIAWDKASNSFRYVAKATPFKNQINNCSHGRLRQLAQWLQVCLDRLSEYRQPIQIAEILENALGKIDEFNSEENIELQIGKQELRAEFIYAAADIVTAKEAMEVPENLRGLDEHIIKTFINEVFLKQQLLDYWFRTLRSRQLAAYSHPIINVWLRNQQRLRQLEVVQTSRYLYAIAPSMDRSTNTFSIRRFLSEDKLLSDGRTYINAVVLDMQHVNDKQHQLAFCKQIENIVTLEGMVSKAIIDLVTKMEENYDTQLLPILAAPLDGTLSLDRAVRVHLRQFENQLTTHVLAPLAHALSNTVSHNDECEYLYVTTRQLLGSVISSFRDFQLQPSVFGNEDCERMMIRLVGYTSLLKKRRSNIFTLMGEKDWQEQDEAAQKPVKQLRELVKAQLAEHRDTADETEKAREDYESPPNFIDKLLKRKEKQLARLQALEGKANKERWRTCMGIMRLAKEYHQYNVFMEFESMLSLTRKERNYAFSYGNNGVSRLPLLQTLPEDHTGFDIKEFHDQLQSSMM